MNEDFVPYELAVKLNEVGFNYDTKEVYEINVSLERYFEIPKPTISQVLKWLREEKKIYIMMNFWPAGYSAEIFTEIGKDKYSFCWGEYIDECDYYESYELAALAGVNYCLDNLI